jgi:HK97 family phage prohead protease
MRERRAPGDPLALIVDIDNTLITFDGDARTEVIDWVNSAEGRLFVVTGRVEAERDRTEQVLQAIGLRAHRLYMKPDSSSETPAFKYALAEELLDEWDIWIAVDDNPDNRAEFRRLGIDAVAPDDLPASKGARMIPTDIAPELRAALDRAKEFRAFARFDDVEERAANGDVVFRGYASVFDAPYDIAGAFTETVKRGAFARTLDHREWRIHLLVNHDESSIPLASVEAGTMRLSEDAHGLRVEAALDPTSPYAQSVISAVRRGDLAEMSFAFSVVRDNWSQDYTKRDLLEVRLYEVSVVRNGANPATTAELASAVTVDTEAAPKVQRNKLDEVELELRLRLLAA